MPAATRVLPVKVLAAVSRSVPGLLKVRLPEPEITPLWVASRLLASKLLTVSVRLPTVVNRSYCQSSLPSM